MVTLVDIVVMQNSWKYFLYYSVQNSWASSLTTKLLKRMCNERRLKKRRMCCKFFIKILYSSSWLIAFFQASKILNTSWAHERHQTNTLLFKHIPFLHTSKILYLSINNCTLILFPRYFPGNALLSHWQHQSKENKDIASRYYCFFSSWCFYKNIVVKANKVL